MNMTAQELKQAMRGLESQIDNYAYLLVAMGLNVQEGQMVVIQASVETYEFVRKVVRHAYEAGASRVIVKYGDDLNIREDLMHRPLEDYMKVDSWDKDMLEETALAGASYLFLTGRDPHVFEGVDVKKLSCQAQTRNKVCSAFRNGMDFGKNIWCIAGVPVIGWATQVFPDKTPEEALYQLWVSVLSVARTTGHDPKSAWETHNATFKKNLRFLNEKKFKKLHYSSKNGTDFTIGLPKGHVWMGGATKTVAGQMFFPNIPTEEVFTSPDYLACDGIVYSALPLIHNGSIVDNFWLKFEGGKVVDFDAERGKEVLTEILNTDNHASYLGECALVSKNTPIRETGVLFYETLYDENASCHLALGQGFAECLEGGLDLSKEELLECHVNQSHTHVDFMIGSNDLNIMGIDENGDETRIFVNGQWAWE